MTLVIGYDASSTLSPRTGIGRVSLEILRALAKSEEPRIELRVWLNSLLRRQGPEHAELEAMGNVSLTRTRRPGPRVVEAWRRGKGVVPEEVLGSGVQIIHSPASYIPPAADAKRVVTVHDLAFLEEAPQDREKLGAAYFADVFPRLLPKVDAIHTVSEFTRSRLLETYDLDPKRVVAIPSGLDPEVFYHEDERHVEIAQHNAGAPKQYLLAVSDHTPRKRNGLLLDVYEALLKAEPATPPLVVVGWGGKPAKELKARTHLYRKVIPLGFLPDETLRGIYTGAVATLITSRHEGFGLPVLEAQACGSPVICGRHSALREVGGDAIVGVEGDSPKDWVEAIRSVAFSAEDRKRVSQAGKLNTERFRWEKTAKGLIELYQRVVDSDFG